MQCFYNLLIPNNRKYVPEKNLLKKDLPREKCSRDAPGNVPPFLQGKKPFRIKSPAKNSPRNDLLGKIPPEKNLSS